MRYTSIIQQWKKPTISLALFNLVLSVWVGIGLNIAFYKQLTSLTPYQGYPAILFLIGSSVLITAAYFFIFNLIHWRLNVKIFASIWIVLGGMSAYFVSSLGIIINADQIQNMMQTNTMEALDLINIRLFIWVVFFILAPLFFIYWVNIKKSTFSHTLCRKMLHSVISLVLVLGCAYLYYVDYAAIFRENRELKGMISPQNVVAASFSYYKHLQPPKNTTIQPYGRDAHQFIQTATHQTPKLMVLVIGETARAESFQLNGYDRATNPELSKLNIINFRNVSSCGTATAVSVPCLFSGMTRQAYTEKVARQRENLLDIIQRAGYKVTWINNNSGCKEVCNRVERYEIPKSIRKQWCDSKGECKDEILIASLNAYIQAIPKNDKTPRLIVLHQMGSHGPAYYKRSTHQYRPFQPTCNTSAIQGCSQQALTNTYDNSIVYTDHILASTINLLNKQTQFQSALWYLSDHGESTGEHGMYLHGAPYQIAPSQQTHVPMIMWFSTAWRKHEASTVRCIESQKNNALSQDNVFHTMLSLLNIHTTTLQPALDLSQQCKPQLQNRA